jgi:hypothetical protein
MHYIFACQLTEMKKFVIVKANDPLRFVTPDLKLHPQYKKAWKLDREHGEKILDSLIKDNVLNDKNALLTLMKAEIFYS